MERRTYTTNAGAQTIKYNDFNINRPKSNIWNTKQQATEAANIRNLSVRTIDQDTAPSDPDEKEPLEHGPRECSDDDRALKSKSSPLFMFFADWHDSFSVLLFRPASITLYRFQLRRAFLVVGSS
jgi:hypothetical protein